MRHFIVLVMFFTTVLSAQAAQLYRWVDENGKVQYSDKPPSGQSKELTELDKQGRARNTGSNLSEAERAAEREKQKQLTEQRRKDKALLQSFSKPEEVDILRDRQLEALAAAQQTNKLRLNSLQERHKRLNQQAERLNKAKKPIPADLQTELDLNRDEIKSVNESLTRQDQDAVKIREKAEADKARLIQLRSVSP
ncbi:DUF4124 domain-containing protein [Chitinibacter sp. S2-10]|uniref:DUF4124 domain-containing protein n=1 Tax=Chitinibacter sp. S2-10 TaxID=3373597 RepID=UPI003977CC5F